MPELYRAQGSVNRDDIQLETPEITSMEISEMPREIRLEIPEINTTEIRELPREIKLEKPIEQSKSKLHPKQKKVLGSKVVRRANPTKLVKGRYVGPFQTTG